jgi:hypothetical protein
MGKKPVSWWLISGLLILPLFWSVLLPLFWPLGVILLIKRLGVDNTANLKRAKWFAVVSYILMAMWVVYLAIEWVWPFLYYLVVIRGSP